LVLIREASPMSFHHRFELRIAPRLAENLSDVVAAAEIR